MRSEKPDILKDKHWIVRVSAGSSAGPFFKLKEARDRAEAECLANPKAEVIVYEAVAIINASVLTHERKLYEWYPLPEPVEHAPLPPDEFVTLPPEE
jgi:hypothetical protein